jgi:hypothetical protein
MADIVYGVSRGQQEGDVVTGTSDPATDVYVVLDDTKGYSKLELLIALDMIKNHINKQDDF